MRLSLALNLAALTVWSASAVVTSDTSVTKVIDAYLAKHSIVTKSAAPSQSSDAARQRDSLLQGKWSSLLPNITASTCPGPCGSAGLDPLAWAVYHSVDRLKSCNKTMLIDFAVFNNLSDPKTHASIAACVANLSDNLANATTTNNSSSTSTLCLPDTNENNTMTITAPLQLSWSSTSSSSKNADEVVAALQELRALSLRSSGCNETIKFALSGKAAVGIYIGPGLVSQRILPMVLEQLADRVQRVGVGESISVQLCDSGDRSARYALGIMAHTRGELAAVQHAVQAWKNSSCITTSGHQRIDDWQNITFLAPQIATNATTKRSLLQARDTCTTIQVFPGDLCPSLATECGITEAEFESYNSYQTDFCNTLIVGQYVCCSSGTPPDYSPQPDAHGNCYAYLVKPGDYCSTIAAAHYITVSDIDSFNNNTWGWMGCGDLLANMNICLSSGYPPMPTTITNAVCGPQMNNTPIAPQGANLSTLNECPLNACCDIWGQCGITAEFCTISQSPTGAPGTAAVKENGCISNCGTDIIVSSTTSKIYTIGYFEGFDWSRPCLTVSIDEVDTSAYTHIHFAFATITTDYKLNITSIQGQLPFFAALTGVKRILSVGGWDFSTDPSTYMIFREAVTAANRATLIQSVVDVLNQYDLDGIDWDWEYPDEPDIAGIPAGTTADSVNYFVLLEELKVSLEGSGKTISLTAPASYWYLKQFPIDAIGAVVDYVVFMTYDMHGQWDYGNAFADPGCSGGNCLRSHVNLTETLSALSMITKAGVPNAQVVVGVASYGRSFKMTTAGCWTEMCTYTGPTSGALPGQCTETAGYIANAEIDEIIANNPSAQVFWDENSFSNILVYNETEWVSYMNSSNKATRTLLYGVYGFLGTADWAIDLQSEGDGSSSSSSSSSVSIGYIGPTIWSEATPVVTGMPGQTLVWPPLQLQSTTTISFDLWTTVLSVSSFTTYTVTAASSSTTSTGYAYNVLTIPTVLTLPPVIATTIPVWNVILPTETTDSIIYLTSSIQPPPITVTVTPVWGGSTSIIEPTTTTQNATVVAWYSETYTLTAVTETVGSSTIIIGGTTGTPIPITITPNPHPTTVDNVQDTQLNSKTTSWSSGSVVSPPCATGCGISCGHWCNPGCPYCPPDIFGNVGGSSGSGSGDGDSSSTSTSSSTTTSASPTYTAAGFHVDNDDSFPDLDKNDYSSLSAMSSQFQSVYNSIFSNSATATSTTGTIQSSTSSTTVSTPTPTNGSKYATFYLMEWYSVSSWTFNWQILDNIGGQTYNPCTTSYDIEVFADTVGPNPDFPDKDIGPFESHGISGCMYTAGKGNTIGTMTCPGVDTITCETDSSSNDSFECNPILMIYVFSCWW